MKNKVEFIQKAGMCVGCGLCAESKSNISIGNDGFIKIEKPISDNISSACPGAIISAPPLSEGVTRHWDWGNIYKSWTGYSNNDLIRHIGSSGGAITGIATYLLESKLVDGVVHVAASVTDPVRNEVFISISRDEIVSRAGSRYGPSAPLSAIREIVEQNTGNFAFIGKPCDVSALREAMRRDARLAIRFPYLLSFFCAGIPSEHGTDRLLNKMGVNRDDVDFFRYRGEGWPGFAVARSKDGTQKRLSYNESWGTVLNRHLHARCKICVDGIGENADISCADAWHGEDGYPSFEEADGRSLILARTKKGGEIVNSMVTDRLLSVNHLAIEEIDAMQPYQMERRRTLFVRLIALRLFGRFVPKYVGFSLIRGLTQATLKQSVRTFAGTLRRVATGRL